MHPTRPASVHCILLCLISAALTTLLPLGKSQADTGHSKSSRMQELAGLPFEELLHVTIETSIANPGHNLNPVRETPAILTVVTKEEIANMGARDLIDILQHVPGFSFGWDTQQLTGLAFRGNWAIEGKILLMIDGFELNERRYAIAHVGNRIAIDQIERVEIIRGAGSVIYGGFAELAVVNVITKRAEDLQGGRVWTSIGFTEDHLARVGTNLMYGNTFGEWEVAAKAFIARTNRTDGDFTDFFGETRSLENHSDVNPLNINLNLQYKDLKLDFLLDNYWTKRRTRFGAGFVEDEPNFGSTMNYESWWLRTSYEWKIKENLSVVPEFTFRRSSSYLTSDSDQDIITNSYKVSLLTEYEPHETTSIFVGGEYYGDRTHTDRPGYFDGSESFELDRGAGFAQADVDSPFGHFSLGVRYEHQKGVGGAFVPRLGYAWAAGKFHVKALANRAFRAPIMENLEGPFADPSIDPEITTIFEGEAGYRLTENLFFVGNAFHIEIKDPIIWTAPSGYSNLNAKTETYGFEAEVRYVHEKGSLKASYSFNGVSKNTADPYKADPRWRQPSRHVGPSLLAPGQLAAA